MFLGRVPFVGMFTPEICCLNEAFDNLHIEPGESNLTSQ